MPRLIVTEGAALGLERCRAFLADKSPQAAERAARVIADKLLMLQTTPAIGRPLNNDPDLRELVIAFGDSGYIALYRFYPTANVVFLLAVRHQREAGYP